MSHHQVKNHWFDPRVAGDWLVAKLQQNPITPRVLFPVLTVMAQWHQREALGRKPTRLLESCPS